MNFSCDNSVAVIPNNWLIDSDSCYWPPYSKSRVPKAARDSEAPTSSWEVYSLTVKKTFG